MKENKTKVLFLDIDGVLNSDSFFNSDYYKKLRQSKGEQGCMHDPRKIALLSEIVKKTHCKVVMSSSWRCFYFGKNDKCKMLAKPIKKDFKKYGIRIKEHVNDAIDTEYAKKYDDWFWSERTEPFEITQFFERGLEIKNYLKAHPEVKQFAILDDCDGDLHLHGEHFVQTNCLVGLTKKDVEKVIELLK